MTIHLTFGLRPFTGPGALPAQGLVYKPIAFVDDLINPCPIDKDMKGWSNDANRVINLG